MSDTPEVDPAAPAAPTVQDEHKVESSSDRLPERPYKVTLENGTVVEYN
jgi:hypothetical protein